MRALTIAVGDFPYGNTIGLFSLSLSLCRISHSLSCILVYPLVSLSFTGQALLLRLLKCIV